VKWEKCGACDVCLGMQTQALAADTKPPRKSKLIRRERNDWQELIRLDCDPSLLAALKKWRRDRARAENVAPFVIFHDSVLERIASKRPRSTPELAQVYGVGEAKLTRFGQDLLGVLRAHGSGGRTGVHAKS